MVHIDITLEGKKIDPRCYQVAPGMPMAAPQAPMDEVDPRVARVRALRGMLCS